MKTKRIRTQRDLRRELRRRGVEVARTGGGHLRVMCPRGPVFMGLSPGGGNRAVLNALAELRRAGLDLEREP